MVALVPANFIESEISVIVNLFAARNTFNLVGFSIVLHVVVVGDTN